MTAESVTAAAAVAAVPAALVLDLMFGDPRNRYHPTAWMGALIARLTIPVQGHSRWHGRLAGTCAVLVPLCVATLLLLLLYVGLDVLTGLAHALAWGVAAAILLKSTIAIRGMEGHAMAVVAELESGRLDAAREKLAMIVKRDTANLDENHVYSAVVESISENMVDGVTGPLFYFGFFGVFGAVLYRIVNTADSMLGYRTSLLENLGWFAANADKILNLVPARLTGILVIPSSMLLGYDWRSSYRIMGRDARKPDSPNAGYPMAAVAGALDARLEKPGHYMLGDGRPGFTRRHVASAIALTKVTCCMFAAVVTVPSIILLSCVGWWLHA